MTHDVDQTFSHPLYLLWVTAEVGHLFLLLIFANGHLRGACALCLGRMSWLSFCGAQPPASTMCWHRRFAQPSSIERRSDGKVLNDAVLGSWTLKSGWLKYTTLPEGIVSLTNLLFSPSVMSLDSPAEIIELGQDLYVSDTYYSHSPAKMTLGRLWRSVLYSRDKPPMLIASQRYVTGVSALLAYDYCLTFRDEVRWISQSFPRFEWLNLP